ncbi:MAG: fasciclin domain-containing protein [Anaerolinea sp.]|nr:fasciclin domain-containing protein [Anaerolinea sp.]
MRKFTLLFTLLTLLTLLVFAVSAQDNPPPVTPVTDQPPGLPTDELTAEPTMMATAMPTTEATSAATQAGSGETPAATAEATDTLTQDNRAHIRFAHFAADAPAVDVFINGSTAEGQSTLEYPSMSDWMTYEAGAISLSIVPAGGTEADAVLGPTDVTLPAGTWHTIAVIGAVETSTINAVMIQEAYDELLPGTGGLTFFNALEGSPTVDLNRGDVVFFAALDYPTLEGGTFFSTLLADSGVYDFRVTANEDPTNTLAESLQQELQENAYTFMALIGTPESPELFIDVTDLSEVAIQTGMLAEPGTLVDALSGDENLTALASAAASAGLAETLSGATEYTIFAPANFAFDELDLTAMSDEQIQNLLLGHVVEGKLTSRDLLSGESITTLAGTPLNVTVENDQIFVNGVQVIAVNIPATNGVVHMLNGVLQPEMAAQ